MKIISSVTATSFSQSGFFKLPSYRNQHWLYKYFIFTPLDVFHHHTLTLMCIHKLLNHAFSLLYSNTNADFLVDFCKIDSHRKNKVACKLYSGGRSVCWRGSSYGSGQRKDMTCTWWNVFRLNRGDFSHSSCLYSLMYGCMTNFKFVNLMLYHLCQSCHV